MSWKIGNVHCLMLFCILLEFDQCFFVVCGVMREYSHVVLVIYVPVRFAEVIEYLPCPILSVPVRLQVDCFLFVVSCNLLFTVFCFVLFLDSGSFEFPLKKLSVG